MYRALLATALIPILVAPAVAAASNTTLTIYHADNDSLFSGDARGGIDGGYAAVHEQRALDVQAGQHTLRIGGLPATVDPEAVMVGFADGANVQVLGRRIVLARGNADSALAGHVGEHVIVTGGNGQIIADGTLLGVDGGLTVRGGDGRILLVHDYATVALPAGAVGGGSLLLDVEAKAAGARNAQLTYTTSGLGWRAAYTATLSGGDACRMHLDPQASIANRSGRDYANATIKLVAGQPNLAGGAPRMYAAKAAVQEVSAMPVAPMPQQRALGDYRSFTLPGSVALPDGTVTLRPLYASRDIPCARQYVVEAGNAWQPPKPLTNIEYGNNGYTDQPITSTLSFDAPEALPAGTLRALTVDHDGAAELLGEGGIADTPKGQHLDFRLGESFDLRASRERSAFSVDNAARTMDEAWRVTLANGGDVPRTVTVREHPSRWRVWKLVSSSVAAGKQTPDTLEFVVPVPAHGKAVLDYRVRYAWTAKDE